MGSDRDKFAAGEQGLGYVYQIRFALLCLMHQEESRCLLIEADDDVQVNELGGRSNLVSLKHKQEGETVGALSVDFWKSVRIWLDRYRRDGKLTCEHTYCMVTTARVGPNSPLRHFLENVTPKSDDIVQQLVTELASSKSDLSGAIKTTIDALSEAEQRDFFSRIVIAERSPRIENLGTEILAQLKAIRQKHRHDVLERLEGWWNQQAIDLIQGARPAISGIELWEKIASIGSEYSDDSLPITFADSFPHEGVDACNDSRQFVEQLRAIGMPITSLEIAILDFYRAFAQRSHWARVNAISSDEVRTFERRLVGEWKRMKTYTDVSATASENDLQQAGRLLYRWAEMESSHIQIRTRVTEEYVRRGTFHILANREPTPEVHWHPLFLERLKETLEVAE
jgi:hypothetical protein